MGKRTIKGKLEAVADASFRKRTHAKNRCLERYGRDLSEEQYWAMCELCKTGKAEAVIPARGPKTTQVIKIGKEAFSVIFDGTQIVTFLPKRSISRILLLAVTNNNDLRQSA